MSQNNTSNVNHSRYLNLSTITAVAGIVPVSVSVYLATSTVFNISGRQTAFTYLISALFFLPIILSLSERVTASKKSSGIFSLMRENHDLRFAYAVGWLMLGGLLFLGALLAYGGGIYLNNERAGDAMQRVSLDSSMSGRYFVLRKGAKKYHLVRIVEQPTK